MRGAPFARIARRAAITAPPASDGKGLRRTPSRLPLSVRRIRESVTGGNRL